MSASSRTSHAAAAVVLAPLARFRTPVRNGDTHAVMSHPMPRWRFPDFLTCAEQEVARAVLSGKNREQVARARGTSARTVANLMAQVFRKLRVQSRLELAVRLGVLREVACEGISLDSQPDGEGWGALLSGAWSVVDASELDGRRYLFVRRTSSPAADSIVTPAEAQALLLRAQPESYKLLALALEVSVSYSHQLVKSGMRKLRTQNEVELPLFLRTELELADYQPRCEARAM